MLLSCLPGIDFLLGCGPWGTAEGHLKADVCLPPWGTAWGPAKPALSSFSDQHRSLGVGAQCRALKAADTDQVALQPHSSQRRAPSPPISDREGHGHLWLPSALLQYLKRGEEEGSSLTCHTQHHTLCLKALEPASSPTAERNTIPISS